MKFRFKLYKSKSHINALLVKRAFLFYKEHRSLFLHIPKSAGVSMHYSLYETDSYGHIPLKDYYKLFGKREVKKCFKFCFVRDPYERLYSAYSYLKKGGRGCPIDLKYKEYLTPIEDFEDFVLNYLDRREIREMEHFRSQTFYLVNKRGKLNIDFIGRYESIEQDFGRLCELLSTKKGTLLKVNKNKDKDPYVLTTEVKEIIYNAYKEDFINFGYRR
ncbi:sulfotransferase family 2 domain-containing protein [Neptunitalea chrysea]|nr:sulfotransferase family 2 domain-containing protein [Neptunitalea chrysea]